MKDITAQAYVYWLGLNLTDEQRSDLKLKRLIIEAFEQGWMQHQVH